RDVVDPEFIAVTTAKSLHYVRIVCGEKQSVISTDVLVYHTKVPCEGHGWYLYRMIGAPDVDAQSFSLNDRCLGVTNPGENTVVEFQLTDVLIHFPQMAPIPDE